MEWRDILENIHFHKLFYGGAMASLLKILWDIYKFFAVSKQQKETQKQKEDNSKNTKPPDNLEVKFDQVLTLAADINSILTDYLVKTKAIRALVIKVEDNSKNKIIGSDSYKDDVHLSILYEAINPKCNGNISPVKSDLQYYRISEEHKEIIYELTKKKSVIISKNDKSANIFNHLIEIDKIDELFVHMIKIVQNYGIIYVTLEFRKNESSIKDATIIYENEILLNKLKNNIKRIFEVKEKIIKKN